MSESKTPNQFSWSELMTRSPAQATEFYGALFGWQFEPMDMPAGKYYVATSNGQQIAGIMQLPEEAPTPVWGQYVTVKDIKATAEKIIALGGTLLTPPTDIPEVGSFVLFQDPQGAVLSAIQYTTPQE